MYSAHGCAVAGQDVEHLGSPWPRSTTVDRSTFDIRNLVSLLFYGMCIRISHSCDNLSDEAPSVNSEPATAIALRMIGSAIGKPRADHGRVRCAVLVPLDAVKRRMHGR